MFLFLLVWFIMFSLFLCTFCESEGLVCNRTQWFCLIHTPYSWPHSYLVESAYVVEIYGMDNHDSSSFAAYL